MNIWEIYLVGILGAVVWAIIDFFKYRKFVLSREYYRESPNKLAFKSSFKSFLNNAWIAISCFAIIYVIGYIFALGFIEAVPHY